MKKSSFSDIYSLTTAALALTFMVSCTKGNQSQSPSVAGAAQPTATNPAGGQKSAQTGGQSVDGTTDGAGGNGLNGKAYESYIVDPMELPPYKNIIADKMRIMNKLYAQMMKEESAAHPNTTIYAVDFAKLFKFKKWYLAPVSLKALSKSVIGVDFFSDPTQQLAIQTENEVWLDSRPYNDPSRTEKERADLLLHEYFMTYLLILREPSKVQCKKLMFIVIDAPKGVCEYTPTDVIEKPKGPLTKKDYERLRATTATVMAFNENTTVAELKAAMDNIGDNQEKQRLQPVTSDAASVLKHAQATELLKSGFRQGLLNGPCYGASTKEERKNCNYEIKISSDGSSAELTVRDNDKNEVLRAANVKLNGHFMVNSYENGVNHFVNRTEFSTYESNFKEGEFVDEVVLITTNSKGSTHHELIGIALKRFVVYSVTAPKSQSSNQNNLCAQLGNVKPTSIYEDTLVLTNQRDIADGLYLDYLRSKRSIGNCNIEEPKGN